MGVVEQFENEDDEILEAATSGVGSLLRATRERVGEDLQSVAAILRIRYPYLEAIEQGRYGDLPGSTYAIGFIRSYAEHLGLDGEEVVRRYKLEAADKDKAEKLDFPVPVSESRVPSGALILIGVIFALLAYGLWMWSASNDKPEADTVAEVPPQLKADLVEPAPEPEPEPAPEPELAPGLEPAPGPEPTLAGDSTPAPETPPEAPSEPAPEPSVPVEGEAAPHVPTVFGQANVDASVVLKASGDSWVEVKEGDKIIFSRIMKDGDSYRVPNRSGIILNTGNAGALTAVVNGKEAPRLGSHGMVRSKVLLEAEPLLNPPPRPPPAPEPPAEPAPEPAPEPASAEPAPPAQ